MVRYVTRNKAGTLRLTRTRVSLASIVHAYWRGEAPETIVLSFPSLSLEQVHGGIAYYLRHREEVDRDLERQEEATEKLRSISERANRALRKRLLKAKVTT